MSKVVLITGASRGIGLEFAKHYKANGWRVIAAVRNPATATKLQELAVDQIVALDVVNEESVVAAAREIGAKTPINLLINNTGIYEGGSLEKTTKEDLVRQFEINSVGPLTVTKAFLPNLQLAAQKNEQAIFAYITSKMGSIDVNKSGGSYGYRASKAALNSIVKCLSIDLAPLGIVTLLLHPGYVQTDLTGHRGDLTVAQSIEAMSSTLEKVAAKDNANFYDIDGTLLPW
ncbi:short chain dehydrogenase [Thraustotheca clavata]|uniref:Short chain dehydrogenase n=1 Tax=Thraustotheca clavata TaxID=74557 RepID=A0A1V9Z2Q3_9STRA|nr:short chain dehydrogenase [Thraustotheca clavata]